MDIASPSSRLQMMLESSGTNCLLTGFSSAQVLPELIVNAPKRRQLKIGWIDPQPAPQELKIAFHWNDLDSASEEHVAYQNTSSDVAHILFTSGSTGLPKGVMITHNNVRHFIEWAIKYFEYSPSDRISGHPPLHFDLSTFDIYGTFAAGAQLHLVPRQLSLLPHKLADFIRRSELTQWFSVPSLLSYMTKFDVVKWNDFPSLRRLLWCGERFPTPALIYWMKRLPHVSFTNLYGPTEATIASSYYNVPKCPDTEESPIPIGTACDGEELLVLDSDLKPASVKEVGDLYIRGVGLSPGYWNDPEKTNAAFLPNPPSNTPDRIYKTGDLASIGEDGFVYLHGRSDSQIKSRGYRIELGEIETALHTTEGVRECAVVAVNTNDFEGFTICCALVPANGIEIHPQNLRRQLAKRLPDYMIPSRWMCTDSLPLNGNGKIDRRQIREAFRANNEIIEPPQ
jgi:amino acid adenylation domain-containing protein